MRLRRNLALALGSSILFFGLVETSLRAVGFRYAPRTPGGRPDESSTLFVRDGHRLVTRPRYEGIFREQRIALPKPAGESRIFVLGGSSVYNLGPMRWLRSALAKDTGRAVRVVNVGGNSVGSTRLLLFLHEILEYEPDLIILYAGHNEYFEEAFKDAFHREGGSILDRLDEALLSVSRTHQLVSFGIHRAAVAVMEQRLAARRRAPPPEFAAKPQYTYPLVADKQKAYRRYERNVAAMVELAQERDLPIVLSTVAYNRMWPPFHPADARHEAGLAAYAAGDYEGALSLLTDALDADRQPRRASRTSNRILADLARRYGVPLVDADGAIVGAAEHDVPGNDLFVDHCHLNRRGEKILQLALAREAGLVLAERAGVPVR